jgi:hypothetical protein
MSSVQREKRRGRESAADAVRRTTAYWVTVMVAPAATRELARVESFARRAERSSTDCGRAKG